MAVYLASRAYPPALSRRLNAWWASTSWLLRALAAAWVLDSAALDVVFLVLTTRRMTGRLVDFATMVEMTGVKRIALLKVCHLMVAVAWCIWREHHQGGWLFVPVSGRCCRRVFKFDVVASVLQLLFDPPHVVVQLDVEGAELDVLEGMTEQHWAMVDQVWIEVLDVHGRMARVVQLLQNHGFTVSTTVEDGLSQLMTTIGMHAVLASRSANGAVKQ